MCAARKSESDVQIVEEQSRGFISRFVRTAIVLLIILYAATLLISRTDGFRYMVEERLKERIGAELSLGKAHMSVRLDLVLRDVAVLDGAPGFHMKRATLRWSFPRMFQRGRSSLSRIVIEDANFRFTRNGEGRWQPAAFVESAEVLSGWAGIVVPAAPRPAAPTPGPRAKERPADDVPAEEIAVFRRETAYVVRGGGVRWEEQDGEVTAELRDMQLNVTPLRVPSRDLRHVWLRVDSGRMADGRAFRDLQVELLVTDQQTILLGMSADWGRD